MNIETARIYIPEPTGFTAGFETYGIRVLGYDRLLYEMFAAQIGNQDDASYLGDFYKILSECYRIDLSHMPAVRPYVMYIDYMKKHGGIAGNDAVATKHLKEKCNTLIVREDAEREFIAHMQSNALSRNQGLYAHDWNKEIPSRFKNVQDKRAAELVRQISSASYAR